MQPEISQYLSGMRKTMEQVVLANLTDRFAQEQAGMIMGTLGFLQLVQDKAFHYELLENHLYHQLLADMLSLIEGDPGARGTAAEAIAAIHQHFQIDPVGGSAHLRPYRFLRASNEAMREHLAALIHLGDRLPADVAERFQALLQPFLHDLQLRERAWVKALGFDSLAEPVPDIDSILYADGRLRLPPGA